MTKFKENENNLKNTRLREGQLLQILCQSESTDIGYRANY